MGPCELHIVYKKSNFVFSRTVATELNQQRHEELYGVMKDVNGFLQRSEGQ